MEVEVVGLAASVVTAEIKVFRQKLNQNGNRRNSTSLSMSANQEIGKTALTFNETLQERHHFCPHRAHRKIVTYF